jgi:hypothetical protein
VGILLFKYGNREWASAPRTAINRSANTILWLWECLTKLSQKGVARSFLVLVILNIVLIVALSSSVTFILTYKSDTVTTTSFQTVTTTIGYTLTQTVSATQQQSIISTTTSLTNRNLISDGGFENGKIGYMTFNGSFWEDVCQFGNSCLFSINTTIVHSGSHSLEGHVGSGDAVFSPNFWPSSNHTLASADRFQASIYFGDSNSTSTFTLYFVNETGPSHGIPKVIYILSTTAPENILCCYHNQTLEEDIFLFNLPSNQWITINRNPMADMASSGMSVTQLTYYSMEINLLQAYNKPTFYDDISVTLSG